MGGFTPRLERIFKERTSFPIQDVRCAYRGGGVTSVKRSQSLKRQIVYDMKCMANISLQDAEPMLINGVIARRRGKAIVRNRYSNSPQTPHLSRSNSNT